MPHSLDEKAEMTRFISGHDRAESGDEPPMPKTDDEHEDGYILLFCRESSGGQLGLIADSGKLALVGSRTTTAYDVEKPMFNVNCIRNKSEKVLERTGAGERNRWASDTRLINSVQSCQSLALGATRQGSEILWKRRPGWNRPGFGSKGSAARASTSAPSSKRDLQRSQRSPGPSPALNSRQNGACLKLVRPPAKPYSEWDVEFCPSLTKIPVMLSGCKEA
ncbi:conserved hypothetical protein [Histoplasma capsulatum H143]|uniref:Uncharacterized protein n=1 Tax=Ajellomyces capsulatus (strain H143) TaxID=544712 RepID=C6HAT0_AJECH|nr:conserved hypothetical protein [Histoplasma capsulatum H143]